MHLLVAPYSFTGACEMDMLREKGTNPSFLEPEKGGSIQEASEVAGTTS